MTDAERRATMFRKKKTEQELFVDDITSDPDWRRFNSRGYVHLLDRGDMKFEYDTLSDHDYVLVVRLGGHVAAEFGLTGRQVRRIIKTSRANSAALGRLNQDNVMKIANHGR